MESQWAKHHNEQISLNPISKSLICSRDRRQNNYQEKGPGGAGGGQGAGVGGAPGGVGGGAAVRSLGSSLHDAN